MQSGQRISTLKFIKYILAPYWKFIATSFFAAIIWSINISLRPFLLRTILNSTQHLNTPDDIWFFIALVALYNVRSMIHATIFTFYDWLSYHFVADVRKQSGAHLMNRLLEHDALFFQHHFVGDLANKVNDVAIAIPAIANRAVDRFFTRFLTFIIAIYTVSTVGYQFSVGLAVWICAYLLLIVCVSRVACSIADCVANQRSALIGSLVDILSNSAVIRYFAQKKREFGYIQEELESCRKIEKVRGSFLLKMNIAERILFIIFQSVCLWWLVQGLLRGSLTGGDFALILTLNLSIADALFEIGAEARHMIEDIGKVGQGISAIMIPAAVQNRENADMLQITNGEITFDKVQFCYKGLAPIFNNKSVVIKAKEKVGLVGPSGSGKSTLISLLLRVFDVEKGRILIDGQDIATVTQESLRTQIGYIPQEPTLFARTIAQNIAYGVPNASMQEIEAAARKAHAHEFIMQLPQQYDTKIGQEGVVLSGGQRQRIAIARAFLKNAPILLLDEATSQLDALAEKYIQDSLAELMQNKTVIVIAHRLSTLQTLDRILVMEKGNIVQSGTHQQLIAQEGLYKKLWDTQHEGFI